MRYVQMALEGVGALLFALPMMVVGFAIGWMVNGFMFGIRRTQRG